MAGTLISVTKSTFVEPAALPVPLRRPAICVAVVAVVTVVAFGLSYEGLTSSTHIDRQLDRLVSISAPDNYKVFMLVRTLGNPRQVVIAAGLLIVLALATGRYRLAVLALAGPGLTGLATTALKPLFDRTLHGQPVYPSGHAGALTSLAIVAALLLVSVLRPSAGIGVLLVSATTLAAGGVMAVALIVLKQHYPTDTIGGFCTAVAIVLGIALLLDQLADARLRRPIPSPGGRPLP